MCRLSILDLELGINPMHYIDEVIKDNTTVTSYEELNLKGEE